MRGQVAYIFEGQVADRTYFHAYVRIFDDFFQRRIHEQVEAVTEADRGEPKGLLYAMAVFFEGLSAVEHERQSRMLPANPCEQRLEKGYLVAAVFLVYKVHPCQEGLSAPRILHIVKYICRILEQGFAYAFGYPGILEPAA